MQPWPLSLEQRRDTLRSTACISSCELPLHMPVTWNSTLSALPDPAARNLAYLEGGGLQVYKLAGYSAGPRLRVPVPAKHFTHITSLSLWISFRCFAPQTSAADIPLLYTSSLGCLVSHLTACCMKRSGSTAENVVRTVPVGTPSSSLINLWFVGKYGASLTSVTEMVTPAVDWKDIWMPLASGAWFDTITVSMKALFIS